MTHNTREGRILSLLKRDKKSTEILFHHRFPTSTSNVRNACHPFSTKEYFDNNYVVVHNGVLYNEKKLKEEHEKLGIKYVSEQPDGRFNDSEALAYDIARYLEGQVEYLTAAGTIAFICIQRNAKGEPVALYFGRNTGNPLKMKMTDYSITLSSVGDGEMVKANTLYRLDYATYKLTESYLNIPEYGSYINYGYGYNTGYTPRYSDYDDDYYEELDEQYESDGYMRGEIRRVKEELMYEGDLDAATAYELGEEQLQGIVSRITKLEQMEMDGTLQGTAEEDEYYELMTEEYYLKKAVQELEKEATRQASLPGFPLSKIPIQQGGNAPSSERKFGFYTAS